MRHQLPLRSPTVRAALTALVVALGPAACAGTTVAALPHCVRAPAGVGPDATATLQLGDDGSTVCLRRGATMTVFLQAPSGEATWSAPVASGAPVLAPATNGALALPIGVTGAAFRARGGGVATLSSVRPPCTIPAISSCDAAHGWHARVVVR